MDGLLQILAASFSSCIFDCFFFVYLTTLYLHRVGSMDPPNLLFFANDRMYKMLFTRIASQAIIVSFIVCAHFSWSVVYIAIITFKVGKSAITIIKKHCNSSELCVTYLPPNWNSYIWGYFHFCRFFFICKKTYFLWIIIPIAASVVWGESMKNITKYSKAILTSLYRNLFTCGDIKEINYFRNSA